MDERYTRDYERLCEIGQEILGATGQTGGWRRPRVWSRRAGTGWAGGPLAADGGVAKAGAHLREMDESSREFARDWAKKFWAHDGRRVAGEGRARGRGGRGAGGPFAADGKG